MRGAGLRSGGRRAGLAALIAGAVLVVGGCQYLLGFPTDPNFSMPSPKAAYGQGRATVTIGSEPAVVLDELPRPGTFDSTFGAEATFRNGDGWHVQIFGAYARGGFMGQTAYLQVDRIVDGQHWTTADPGRCVVTITAADERALRGSATCKGLRWSDALGGGMGNLEPPYIPGQSSFDAEITFEALPKSTQVG